MTTACGVDLVCWILWLILDMLLLVGFERTSSYRIPLTYYYVANILLAYVAYPGVIHGIWLECLTTLLIF